MTATVKPRPDRRRLVKTFAAVLAAAWLTVLAVSIRLSRELEGALLPLDDMEME